MDRRAQKALQGSRAALQKAISAAAETLYNLLSSSLSNTRLCTLLLTNYSAAKQRKKPQQLLVKETRRVKMEINSRGSSTTRSSEPTENASLIENQEPIDFDDSSIISQGAEAAATVADPPLVSVGDPPPTSGGPTPAPNGPPPVYCPQGELPPPYHVAATLPTYEEAELIKGDKTYKNYIVVYKK